MLLPIEQQCRIESEQALPSACAIIKELLDNAIDAQPSDILISTSNHAEIIIINDNGHGISDVRRAVARNTTSKVSDASVGKLLHGQIDSMGFRGQALPAILYMCESVEIHTKTTDSESHLQSWQGEIVSSVNTKKSESFKDQDNSSDIESDPSTFTHVKIRNPFYRHETRRHAQRALIPEVMRLVYEYAIIHCDRISFRLCKIDLVAACKNEVDGGGASCSARKTDDLCVAGSDVVFESHGCHTTHQVLARILQRNPDFVADNYRELTLEGVWEDDNRYRCWGLMSNPHDSAVAPRVKRLGYQATQKKVEGGYTQRREKFIMMAVNKRPVDVPGIIVKRINAVYRRFTSKNCPGLVLLVDYDGEVDINMSTDKRTVLLPFVKDLAAQLETTVQAVLDANPLLKWSPDTPAASEEISAIVPQSKVRRLDQSFFKVGESAETSPPALVPRTSRPARMSQQLSITQMTSITPAATQIVSATPSVTPSLDLVPLNREGPRPRVTLRWTPSELKEEHVSPESVVPENIVPDNESLFKRLQLVGSYRKSFIVCEYDGSLYLVDQHAADEKYWFEKLNNSINLTTQRLLQPLKLDLSSELREVLRELEARGHLKANGFAVEFQDRTLLVTHVPSFKGILLGVNDLMDLVESVDSPEAIGERVGDYREQIWTFQQVGGIPRPPRIWNILAMKACKSAVRFGEQLSLQRMSRILHNLSTLSHPWNCPHGRPTIKKVSFF